MNNLSEEETINTLYTFIKYYDSEHQYNEKYKKIAVDNKDIKAIERSFRFI